MITNSDQMTATIQYKIRVHIDKERRTDTHPVFTVNAENKEEALQKVDWAIKRMFTSGDLDSNGLRAIEYEPVDQNDSHWTKIGRDIAGFLT